MSHVIVVRVFKPGDESGCQKLVKNTIKKSINSAFISNLLREITFELMTFTAAIMYIFFGLPVDICFVVVPLVVISTYIATYLTFTAIAIEKSQELENVQSVYMSNAFSCFWVAEAYEPHLMTHPPQNIQYSVLSEDEFLRKKIDVSSQAKKIVGVVGLLKSRRIDDGAWIKMLCVDKKYQRKGIGLLLLSTAIEFATYQGYSCADLVASEYAEGIRDLCFNMNFGFRQMYHKPIVGYMINHLLYELTYKIKNRFPTEDLVEYSDHWF